MWKILLLVVALVFVEVKVWGLVIKYIGGLGIFFATLFAIMFGSKLLRKSAVTAAQLKQTATPSAATHAMPFLFTGLAGILFILPGLFSDLLGLILLIPMVQQLLARYVQSFVMNRFGAMYVHRAMQTPHNANATDAHPFDLLKMMQEQMQERMRGASGTSSQSTIIEGEATEVSEKSAEIEHKK